MAPPSRFGIWAVFGRGARAGVLAGTLLLPASQAVGDDADSSMDYLPTTTSVCLDQNVQASDRMRLGADAAPWLPQMLDVLKANRPPAWRPAVVALFEGTDDRQYLATIWRGNSMWAPRIEFHGAVRDADGRLKLHYYRYYRHDVVRLHAASGQGLFPGEAPVAVFGLLNQGSLASGSSLRLVQMKRNTVDITPDAAGRLVDVRDLDDDGTYEAISVDDSWTGFYDTRGAAGPFMPVVSARVDGRFVPACRRFRPYHAPWNDHRMRIARDADKYVGFRAEALTQVMLTHAQTGAFDEARAMLNTLIALLNSDDGRKLLGREAALDHFPDVLARAERYADLPCPVLAAVIQGMHPGADSRSDYLRFEDYR